MSATVGKEPHTGQVTEVRMKAPELPDRSLHKEAGWGQRSQSGNPRQRTWGWVLECRGGESGMAVESGLSFPQAGEEDIHSQGPIIGVSRRQATG